MRLLFFLLLVVSNLSLAQSIQAWVGSPYYFNLSNQLNYQGGLMFKVNSGKNNFGLGVEYATKNVETLDATKRMEYKLPQLNFLVRYERLFEINEKNRLAANLGATVSFMANNSFTYHNGISSTNYNMSNGTGTLGRIGFAYFRTISNRVNLFGEIFGQYKFVQDMPDYRPGISWKYEENPRDHISVGLNLGVEVKLKK